MGRRVLPAAFAAALGLLHAGCATGGASPSPSPSSPPPSSPSPVTASPPGAVSDDADRACLDGLGAGGVDFTPAPPTRGVRTPIRVRGPLGAVRLTARDRREGGGALMDCALAQALIEAGPIFADAGIRELIYSGTYQYRTRRGSSKLSQHAHGLAVDVHALVTSDGTVLDLRRDYERGAGTWAVTELAPCVGTPATDTGRLLRTLACRLRATSILREVITADDNSDHNDHFHLEAFPDAFTRARALLSPRIAVVDD